MIYGNPVLGVAGEGPSYHANMGRVPGYLSKYFQGNGFVLIYPSQAMEMSTLTDILFDTTLFSKMSS